MKPNQRLNPLIIGSMIITLADLNAQLFETDKVLIPLSSGQ